MRRRPTQTVDDDSQAIRFAWSVAFFVTIALVAILSLACSAQALTVPATAPLGAAATFVPLAEEEDEDEAASSEDEEDGFEECEEAEEPEEGEEVEICPAPGDEDAAAPPPCLLIRTAATVAAKPDGDKVRLAIRYEAYSPAAVTIDYSLRGGKGALGFEDARKQLGRSGVVHLIETLDEAQMEKVAAARDFTVQLRPAGAPRYCNPLLDRRLSAKRASGGGLTWSDPAASFKKR